MAVGALPVLRRTDRGIMKRQRHYGMQTSLATIGQMLARVRKTSRRTQCLHLRIVTLRICRQNRFHASNWLTSTLRMRSSRSF